SFLFLSAVTAVTPFTSLRAASVFAAHPAQCQPDTFIVSVFSAASAALPRPAASAKAKSFLMMSPEGWRGARASRQAARLSTERASLLDVPLRISFSRKPEDPARVRGGGALDFGHGDPPYLRELLRGQTNVGGLVPLAPVRHGRKERAVRLH